MDFFNRLKGMVIEDDPQAPAPKQAQAPQGAPQQPSQGGAPMNYHQGPILNTQMVEAIRKATFSRNTALTTLITASDQLKDIIPDPVMRLKAAQKTAGGGRSAKEISEAVTIHLNDVDGEELRFQQMLNTKIQTEVGGLNRQADGAESQVKTMNEEIGRLAQRITELQQNVGEQTGHQLRLRSEAAQREAELRDSEVQFKAAANAVRDELNGHKSTILSTLG